MREDLKRKLLRVRRREIERAAEEALVEQLLAKIEISLPAEFVEREMEAWAVRRRMEGQVEGIAEEEIAKQLDAGRADAQRAIEADMKRYFLLDRVAEAESIEVAPAEMAQAIQEIATAYGRTEDEVLSSFRDQGRLQELHAQMRHRKARETIRQNATLVEVAEPAKAPGAKAAAAEAPTSKKSAPAKAAKAEAPAKGAKKEKK
jgi:FKBP-type peptidyl-prolyl cis-trans isomerase (trigger factor)